MSSCSCRRFCAHSFMRDIPKHTGLKLSKMYRIQIYLKRKWMEKREEKGRRKKGNIGGENGEKGKNKSKKNLNKIYHFISQCTSMRLSMTCMKISFVTFMNDDENFGGIFFLDLEAFKPKRIFVNRHQKYDPLLPTSI